MTIDILLIILNVGIVVSGLISLFFFLIAIGGEEKPLFVPAQVWLAIAIFFIAMRFLLTHGDKLVR